MVLEIGAVAAAVVKILAPFTPFLIDAGKTASEKFAEAIGEKGGESAWQKAQQLWSKLNGNLEKDTKVQSIAQTVAADPADEDSLRLFAKTLAQRLEDHPELTKQLIELLGGEQAVQQEVIAERGSWIEDVLQSGAGKKTVRASDDSVIKGVKQVS